MLRPTGIARRIVSRFDPGLAGTAACTACGQVQGDGVRLIAGPGVYLCSGCIAAAAQRVAPRRSLANASLAPQPAT
jgi:hypothetical protein